MSGATVKSVPKLPTVDELTSQSVNIDPIFIGLAGVIDQPRGRVKSAIGTARKAKQSHIYLSRFPRCSVHTRHVRVSKKSYNTGEK